MFTITLEEAYSIVDAIGLLYTEEERYTLAIKVMAESLSD